MVIESNENDDITFVTDNGKYGTIELDLQICVGNVVRSISM